MLDPETWIKLLSTYGPFALLILFVFVIENKARKTLNESSTERRSPFLVVYLSVWAVIFILVIFIAVVWYIENFTAKHTIAGTFENLTGNHTINSKESLYLCRRYLEGDNVYYEWRLITDKRLKENTKIPFIFNRGSTKESKDNVTEHELIIRESFYKDKVRIRYNRQKNKLILIHAGKEEEIPPLENSHPGGLARFPSFSIGVAHADEPANPADYAKRLESDDPIIRRDARLELGKLGEKALPWILKVLETPTSSYRLKVGVITALGNMAQVKPEQLSQAAVNAVIEASVDNDLTIRGSALRFFGKHPSREHLAQLQQAVVKTRASGADPERLSRLARAQLEILYNIGVREKDLYGSKREEDKGHLQTALNAFKEAWELRTLAVPEDQIYFTKALYGWGLALHDRSWIERLPNGQRNPDLVKAAQDKFREFLQAYDRAPNKEKYPYAKHDDCARAYIENPVPQSLKQ